MEVVVSSRGREYRSSFRHAHNSGTLRTLPPERYLPASIASIDRQCARSLCCVVLLLYKLFHYFQELQIRLDSGDGVQIKTLRRLFLFLFFFPSYLVVLVQLLTRFHYFIRRRRFVLLLLLVLIFILSVRRRLYSVVALRFFFRHFALRIRHRSGVVKAANWSRYSGVCL